ncbi:uncharacterized protein PAN0_019d5788 [Moesziomyces antarcticus]|uniref:Uncharacterized protein n=2 Tax=Pseudozyma antarctica TaxID=84753 RepID=A0A081CLL4_PSEA2|nr:uncharacterized protein PAN0_019d5788 [Moesziomyces antarcticus]GAK67560.1 hypothetical protein PAN0_019d5788 [Moesziomyces antarcticus]SPO48825.1 uncharacterized protein PSANT_06516 [Moesziomyces antarcticus]
MIAVCLLSCGLLMPSHCAPAHQEAMRVRINDETSVPVELESAHAFTLCIGYRETALVTGLDTEFGWSLSWNPHWAPGAFALYTGLSQQAIMAIHHQDENRRDIDSVYAEHNNPFNARDYFGACALAKQGGRTTYSAQDMPTKVRLAPIEVTRLTVWNRGQDTPMWLHAGFASVSH